MLLGREKESVGKIEWILQIFIEQDGVILRTFQRNNLNPYTSRDQKVYFYKYGSE